MMKKAISLFLAVFVLCCATSAMATPAAGTVTGMRNTTNTLGSSDSAAMPCFKAGDTISFNLTSVTSGNELTVISYKNGSSLSDSTVQFMEQYTLTANNKTITFTIRDLDAGVYLIKFNNGGNDVATFYYKIGKVTTALITKTGTVSQGSYGTPYYAELLSDGTYAVGFLGKVTVTNQDVTLEQMGANPGFTVKGQNAGGTVKTKSYAFGLGTNVGKTVAGLDGTKLDNVEAPSRTYLYVVTIYGVPEGKKGTFTATTDPYYTSAN